MSKIVKIDAINIEEHVEFAANQYRESIAHLPSADRAFALKELAYVLKLEASIAELSHEA